MFKTIKRKIDNKFVVPSSEGVWVVVNDPMLLSKLETIESLKQRFKEYSLNFEEIELIEHKSNYL